MKWENSKGRKSLSEICSLNKNKWTGFAYDEGGAASISLVCVGGVFVIELAASRARHIRKHQHNLHTILELPQSNVQ